MVQLVNRASDVRIQEINLSAVITSSSSSTACIPIISKQGNIEPRHFTNGTDFLFEYGDPDPSVSMTTQAALNFFSEGNDLWAIRVVGTNYKTAGVLMTVDSTDKTKLTGVGTTSPSDMDISTLSTEDVVALFYPSRGPGSHGNNLSIKIKSLTITTPANFTAVPSASGGTLAAGNYKYQVSAINGGGESLATTQVTATTTGTTGSVVLDWDPVEGAIGYYVYGRSTTGFGLLAITGGGTSTYTDVGGTTAETARQPITNPALAAISDEFVVYVYDNTNLSQGALEEWTCTLTPKISSSGVQMELEDQINPFSSYIQVVSNVAALLEVPAVTSVATTDMLGGDSGTAPTSYNVANALQVFSNNQLYGTNIFINGGIADPVLQLAMDTLVQKRGDAVALLDVPSSKQKFQKAIDYRNLELNLNSSYSALFGPDLLQADLINGKQVYNPASGWAAALCARTDRVANPAYSIAGLNRGLLNVLKTRYQYDDGAASAMYNAQVNYSRTFVGQGIALWEQRTLAAQFSALSWLSVRRIVNVIKVSLYKFLLYALQEMNTDAVRRQLVNSCTSYLDTVKSAQGLYDFSVVCDNSNNTAATANAGILVLTVILIPSIPIHEIQLQIVISRQGVSFKEALSQVT